MGSGFSTALVACVSLGASTMQAGPARAVTFHRDVQPILQQRCQVCHRAGEAAPFSMAAYQEVRPWAKAIREAVLTRKMPPWFADAAPGTFSNDNRLSQQEIDTLIAWVDQGAPAGDPIGCSKTDCVCAGMAHRQSRPHIRNAGGVSYPGIGRDRLAVFPGADQIHGG